MKNACLIPIVTLFSLFVSLSPVWAQVYPDGWTEGVSATAGNY